MVQNHDMKGRVKSKCRGVEEHRLVNSWREIHKSEKLEDEISKALFCLHATQSSWRMVLPLYFLHCVCYSLVPMVHINHCSFSTGLLVHTRTSGRKRLFRVSYSFVLSDESSSLFVVPTSPSKYVRWCLCEGLTRQNHSPSLSTTWFVCAVRCQLLVLLFYWSNSSTAFSY